MTLTFRTYNCKNYNYLVINRYAGQDFTCSAPHIIISITDPDQNLVEYLECPSRLGLLRLQFHDIKAPLDDYKPCSEQDAQAAVNFITKHKDRAKLIVFQCEGGVSRSAGLAAAIANWLDGEGDYFFKRTDLYGPNPLVYGLVTEAVEQMGKSWNNW